MSSTVQSNGTRKKRAELGTRITIGRSPARPPGRISKLAYLVRDQTELYAKMLSYVRAGAYLHVAAAAIGVAPETISRWLSKGEAAKTGPYAQFRQDILRAVAEASLIAEAEVKQNKPETWLRRGPRRLLGDEWRDAETQPSAVVNVATTAIVSAPSLDTIAAAMVELYKAGVGLPVEARLLPPEFPCLAPGAALEPTCDESASELFPRN